MNRNAKGLGFYLVIGVIILLLLMTFRGGLEASQTWNQKEYEEALENGEVARVDITPNQEVPTGILRVVLTDGAVKYVNSADVKEEQNRLMEYPAIETNMESVRRDNIFLTTFLPTLVVGARGGCDFYDDEPSGRGQQRQDDELRKKQGQDDHSGRQARDV